MSSRQQYMSDNDDAYIMHEKKVERKREAEKWRLSRIGVKRKEERRRNCINQMERERIAVLVMTQEDKLSKAYEIQCRSREEAATYKKEIMLYRKLTETRKQAHKLHLDIKTPGLTSQERLQSLESRLQEQKEGAIRAAAAKNHLLELHNKKNANRQVIANASTHWWYNKMEIATSEQNCLAYVNLISHGADPDHESWNHFTPLIGAIVQRKQDIVKRCLELKADPNYETSDGKTALLCAVLTNDMLSVQMLLETPDCNKETGKHVARASLCFETKKGGLTAMLLACEKGRLEMVKYFLQQPHSSTFINQMNVHGITPLMQAAKSNQLAISRLLLRHGANAFCKSKSKLTAADYARSRGFLRLSGLCARGNDLNLDPSTPSTFEERHEEKEVATAQLKFARSLDKARLDEAMSFIDLDFMSPNFESPKGNMLFHLSCMNGTVSQVSTLMRRCLWTQRNQFGISAMMEAAKRGRLDILILLHSQGGSFTQSDMRGHDCFWYLHSNGHDEVLQFLLKHKKNDSNDDGILWWPLNVFPKAIIESKIASSLPMKLSPMEPPVDASPKIKTTPGFSMCSVCLELRATKWCLVCREEYCDRCYMQRHIVARWRHHAFSNINPHAERGSPPAAEAAWKEHMDACRDIFAEIRNALNVGLKDDLSSEALSANHRKCARAFAAHQSQWLASQLSHHTETNPIFAAPVELRLLAFYRDNGRFEEAASLLQQVRTMQDTLYGGNSSRPCLAHLDREDARLHIAQKKFKEGTFLLKQALVVLQGQCHIDHRDTVSTLEELYEVLDLQGRFQDGVLLARETLHRRREALAGTHPLIQSAIGDIERFVMKREQKEMYLEDPVGHHLVDRALHQQKYEAESRVRSPRLIASFEQKFDTGRLISPLLQELAIT